ncbi:MAG TPA: DUF1949 domain-containing protein, partial [Niallia sp.]|nr:DUF1949 domain-containing protein [Niallia sp.]
MNTNIDYTWLGKVENELRSSTYLLKEIHYLNDVNVEAYVEEEKKTDFIEWMTELTNGKGDISEGDVVYLEEDVQI